MRQTTTTRRRTRAEMSMDEMLDILDEFTASPSMVDIVKALMSVDREDVGRVVICAIGAAKATKKVVGKVSEMLPELPSFFMDTESKSINMSRLSKLGHMIFAIPSASFTPRMLANYRQYASHIESTNVFTRGHLDVAGEKDKDGIFRDRKMQSRQIINEICSQLPPRSIIPILHDHLYVACKELIRTNCRQDEINQAMQAFPEFNPIMMAESSIGMTIDRQGTTSSRSAPQRPSPPQTAVDPVQQENEEAKNEVLKFMSLGITRARDLRGELYNLGYSDQEADEGIELAMKEAAAREQAARLRQAVQQARSSAMTSGTLATGRTPPSLSSPALRPTAPTGPTLSGNTATALSSAPPRVPPAHPVQAPLTQPTQTPRSSPPNDSRPLPPLVQPPVEEAVDQFMAGEDTQDEFGDEAGTTPASESGAGRTRKSRRVR